MIIICSFSSSSKEFFSRNAFVLVLSHIVILRIWKILAFFCPMGYEDHERKEPVRPSRKKIGLDIVTIDGPAGAGKSTVGKMLAQRLKYLYLDTGAMYRTVALRAKEQGVGPEDEGALKRLCRGLDITFQGHKQGQRVICQGEDVSAKIREPDIGWLASAVSMKRPVRQAMVRLQRKIGAAGKVVAEGRDTGTVVFPRAKFKFFLDARLEERARRRHRELVGKGLAAEVKKVEKEMRARDEQDSSRELAPLHPAADARHIDSTGISAEGVVEKIMAVIEKASRLRGHRGDG
jgi:cytidylate kinase